MKKFLFITFLLTLTLNACTNNEENDNSYLKQQLPLVTNNNEAVLQLMIDMEEVAKQYQTERLQTRNWRHFLHFAFADASGYGAGRRLGFSRTLSLGMAVLSSLLSASFSDTTVEPDSSNTSIIYNNPTLPEQIGNAHNLIIVKKVGSNPVKDININIQAVKDINNDAINKLENNTIDDFRPNTVKSSSLTPTITEDEANKQLNFAQTIAAQQNIEDMNETVKKLIGTNDSSDFDFIKQYVTNISDINDKNIIRKFTISINNKIDRSSLSEERADDLKTMIAIAENSFLLWKVTEL